MSMKHIEIRNVVPMLARRASRANRVSFVVALLCALLGFTLSARAIDQAMGPAADPHAALNANPAQSDEAALLAKVAEYKAQDRTAFNAGLHLDKLRLLAVNHADTVKILDTWARENLRLMRHKTSIDGQDPLITALDMAFRQEYWLDQNIIYVEAVPVREALESVLDPKDIAEKQRIRDEGTVSPAFLTKDRVRETLEALGNDSRTMAAVGKLDGAFTAFFSLRDSLLMVPPVPAHSNDPWLHPDALADDWWKSAGPPAATQPQPKRLEYATEQERAMGVTFTMLSMGWETNDLKTANASIDDLARVLPTANPAVYPSPLKANVELWYNRTFNGMLTALVYFAAMVLFFMTAIGVSKGIRKWAVGTYATALACHVLIMGVRWWLVGRIPIQNEFESVLGSACLGCCIGFGLELWGKKGIFGTAFAFVGFFAMTCLMAAPYVFGTDLGAAPGRVAGVLTNNIWLYIHVNIVIASYALIFASAIIAMIYLAIRLWHWVNPIEPGYEKSGGDGGELAPVGAGEKPQPRPGPGGAVAAAVPITQVLKLRDAQLGTLDQANMVVLQMAFWFLGTGIFCGAAWANYSWGRPWGWDPKETFALVTWIVYLVIVHVRLAVKNHKADWSAWLALGGCAVMLFNWIGVNFFLKGLHSYA